MAAARTGRGLYRCAACQGIYGRKEVQADHIVPVIDPVAGFVSYDELVARLFCPLEGYQILCKPCHNEKSALEGVTRRARKSKKVD